jgi:hypothetical protein
MLYSATVQILGLSDSTPKPENRFKALLWPSIRHETDVDHITRQGFWICFAIAVLSLIAGALQGGVVFGAECYEALFYFLSGVGIRMRSVFAAICVLVAYVLGSFFVGFSILRIVVAALLLANARGTWLSAQWRSTQTEPPPVPMNATLAEKLSDRLPIAVWPWGRYLYYFFVVFEGALLILGIVGTLSHHR